jgi:hypothetical protein
MRNYGSMHHWLTLIYRRLGERLEFFIGNGSIVDI